MKTYKVWNVYCRYEMHNCQRLMVQMQEQGFKLVRLRSFGRFTFEYDPRVLLNKSYFYCFENSRGWIGGKALLNIKYDMMHFFDMVEPVRIGTRHTIYRLIPKKQKDKIYLNRIAQRFGDEFVDEEDKPDYGKLAQMFNLKGLDIMRKSRKITAILLLSVALVLGVGLCVTSQKWIAIPFIVALITGIINLIVSTVMSTPELDPGNPF